MSRIVNYVGRSVTTGDLIYYNGIHITLTDKIISDNPEIFKPISVAQTSDNKTIYLGDPYWFYWTKNPAHGQEVNKPYFVRNSEKLFNLSPDARFFLTEEDALLDIENNNVDLQYILQYLKTPIHLIPDKKTFYLGIYLALVDLFNDGWEPKAGESKWFIGNSNRKDEPNPYKVYLHESVLYCMPYMKTETIAYKILKIMGENIKYIF